MSEFEPSKPHPIPIESNYRSAAESTDDEFQQHGGAWAYYHKISVIDAQEKEGVRRVFSIMSSQARLIEPIEDDNFNPIDPKFHATHAFRAGLWTGGLITKYLHEEKFNYETINDSITHTFPHSTFSTQEEYEANGRFLTTIGHEGLKIAGYDTRVHLDKWAEDIVSQENVRRYYALGAGAVVYATHQIYSSLYEELQLNYQVSQFSKDIDQYLENVADASDS